MARKMDTFTVRDAHGAPLPVSGDEWPYRPYPPAPTYTGDEAVDRFLLEWNDYEQAWKARMHRDTTGKLRAARDRLGWSLRDASTRVGFSVEEFENGRPLDPASHRKIAAAYVTRLQDLVDDVDPQPERKKTMNYSTAVFLINDKARAILATTETEDGRVTGKRATRMFKTLDPSIKVDDFVVVPTETGMIVRRVVEVDVDVDPETPHKVEWVIGRVDVSGYAQLLIDEEDAIAKIKSAEMLKRRKELRENLLADHADKLSGLKLADMAALEPPKK